MPVVPNFSIPEIAPDAHVDPIAPDTGLAAAQALGNAGATISQGEERTAGTVLQLQQVKDQSDALQASNNFDTAKRGLLFGPQGLYSLQGKAAIDAYQPTLDKLQALQQQFKGQLDNPFAQNVFEQTSSYMMNREADQMSEHVAQETVNYKAQAIDGAVSNAADNAMLNYNNPAVVDAAFHTAMDGSNQIAQIKGLGDDAARALAMKSTSAIAGQVLDGAMSKDPATAATLFGQFQKAGYMDGPTTLKYKDLIERSTVPGEVNDIASGVLGTGSGHISTDQATAQWDAESGGQQFEADGKTPLVSTKGAVGVAQLIPSTAQATAAAHGIPWDPNRLLTDPAYNKQLGTLHMNDLMQQYGGNYPAALAAYNAGPNDPGVRHFAATGDMSQLPAETRAYVNKIMAATGYQPPQPGRAGGPMSLDQMGEQLPTLMQEASDRAAALYPNNPDAGPLASAAVASQYRKMKSAFDDQQTAALSAVSDVVTENKYTSLADVQQHNPDAWKAYNSLSPEKQKSVQTMLAQNVPGADTKWSPKAQQTYEAISGLAITDPAAFAHVNLTSPDMLNVLPQDMIKDLANKQLALASKIAAGVPAQSLRDVLDFVSPLAVSAGLNPKAKPGTPAYDQWQQFAGALSADVTAEFTKRDQMPDAATQQQLARRLLVRGSVAGSGTLLFGPRHEMFFQADQGNEVDPRFQADIPADRLSAINAAYTKQFGHAPDLATATQLYLGNPANL